MIRHILDKYFSRRKELRNRSEKTVLKNITADLTDTLTDIEWESFAAPPTIVTSQTEAFVNSLIRQKQKEAAVRRKMAVAAILLLVIASASFYYYTMKASETGPKLMQQARTQRPVIHINKGPHKLIVDLPDCSQAVLHPGSALQYTGYSLKRDLHLRGTAVFSVQEDKRHPFTVYCNNIATTALGTIFRVSQQSGSRKVAVTLIKGKIVVRSLKGVASKQFYYLKPGNSITFNITKKIFNTPGLLQPPEEQKILPEKESAAAVVRSPEDKKTGSGEAVSFQNEPLSGVFDRLARTYGVTIAYPTKKISSIKFIGTFKKSESLKKILSDIALMNDFTLMVDSVNNKYIIR